MRATNGRLPRIMTRTVWLLIGTSLMTPVVMAASSWVIGWMAPGNIYSQIMVLPIGTICFYSLIAAVHVACANWVEVITVKREREGENYDGIKESAVSVVAVFLTLLFGVVGIFLPFAMALAYPSGK